MPTDVTKEAYQQQIEAQLRKVDVRIDLLRAEEGQMEVNARREYDEFMEDLQSQRANIDEELQALAQADVETWQDKREAIDTDMKTLSTLVSEAAERFNVISPDYDVLTNKIDKEFTQ